MGVYIFIIISAYLIGSINFSVIVSKKFAGFDVREKGSGNAGATNVLRTVGKKAGIITLLLDVLKGAFAVIVAIILSTIFKNADGSLLVQLSGIFVIIGHTLPIFFEFKGGKGVATALGVLLLINFKIGLICIVFALALILITKTVSIGSLLASILFPIIALFETESFRVEGNYVLFGIIVALIIMFNHRENIKRILNGTENKLGAKK